MRFTPFALAQLGAAFLLLVAVGRHTYDFYTLMRWVVCGVSGYAAFAHFDSRRIAWAWSFGVLAIAFNPIVPVRLSRATWEPIDVVAAGVLIASVVMNRKPFGRAS